MAIPFNLPTHAETEENYRILNQLLVDLYDVLRQILLMRRTPPPDDPQPRRCGNPPPERPAETANEQQPPPPPALPLPDLVLSATPPPLPPRQRRVAAASTTTTTTSSSEAPVRPPRRRRPRTPPEAHAKASPEPEATRTGRRREDWMRVGENLRKVADDFRASLEGKDKTPPPEPDLKAHWSLLSLLVPAPFSGSLWTAVIFLLGWKLFTAAR